MVYEVKVFPSKTSSKTCHAVVVLDGVACACSCQSWFYKNMPCYKMKEIGVSE
tara:strand:+ start:1200 stop:1358 length:159 start_codon:yes stop_codon:yes gene_type:complete